MIGKVDPESEPTSITNTEAILTDKYSFVCVVEQGDDIDWVTFLRSHRWFYWFDCEGTQVPTQSYDRLINSSLTVLIIPTGVAIN